MPTMPRPLCSEQLCSNPAVQTKGKCQYHIAQYDRDIKSHTRYRHVYNSKRWKGLRQTVRKEQPHCAVPGCMQLWTDLDHITPLSVNDENPYDRQNVQGLCRKHHSEKTRKEVYGFKENIETKTMETMEHKGFRA